jgi:hypothetical protein
LHMEVLFYLVAIERCVLLYSSSLSEAVRELGLYATRTLEHLYDHCARVNADSDLIPSQSSSLCSVGCE